MARTDQREDNRQQESRALQPIERLGPPRIPVTQGFLDARGLTEGQWRVLLDSTFPTARSVEAFDLAITYCKQHGYDIFSRAINIVPMWSTQQRRYIETIWPSIFSLRATAARTGQYAGNDKPVFGPKVEREFTDVYEDERDTRNNRTTVYKLTYPEFCEFTVYRWLERQRMPFNSIVFWTEYYATASRTSEAPNTMWRKMPFGQIQKCAEAAALRRGFPEEVGNEYTDDEMHGKVIEHLPDEVVRGHVVSPQRRPPRPPERRAPPAPGMGVNQPTAKPANGQPAGASAPQQKPEDIVDADYTVEGEGGGGITETDAQFLDELRSRINEARNEAELDTIWNDINPAARFAQDADSLQIADSIRTFRLTTLKGGNR